MSADTVTVRAMLDTLPVAVTKTPRDVFDVFNLLALLIVSPIIALLAARYGARKGGELARKAAAETHEAAVEADRKARAEERAADEAEARRRVRSRLERTLKRVIVMTEAIEAKAGDDLEFIAACSELQLLWESYHRQSDDLHLVGGKMFQEEVETFLASLQTVAAAMLAARDELNHKRMLHAVSPNSGKGISNIITEFAVSTLRDQFLLLLKPKRDRAAVLLSKLAAFEAEGR